MHFVLQACRTQLDCLDMHLFGASMLSKPAHNAYHLSDDLFSGIWVTVKIELGACACVVIICFISSHDHKTFYCRTSILVGSLSANKRCILLH